MCSGRASTNGRHMHTLTTGICSDLPRYFFFFLFLFRTGMCKSKAAAAVSMPSQLRREPPEEQGEPQAGEQASD